MILTTRRKIGLAAVASRAVRACGVGPVTRVRRGAIQWELDLREGIDFAIWLTGRFEGGLDAACRRVIAAGSVVVDIGANMGAHSLPLARAVGAGGKVLAVEPTREAFGRLTRNLALNPALRDRVEAVQAMLVADSTQPLDEEIYSSWPLTPSMGKVSHPLHLGVARSTGGAQAITLDDLLTAYGVRRVDFIKLDVDGFELDVLAGARETLRTFRPAVAMELAPYVMIERGHPADAAVALLRGQGYEFHTLAGRPLTTGLRKLLASLPHGASVNLLALPERTAAKA